LKRTRYLVIRKQSWILTVEHVKPIVRAFGWKMLRLNAAWVIERHVWARSGPWVGWRVAKARPVCQVARWEGTRPSENPIPKSNPKIQSR
jgi:hypothetical protein